MLVLEQKKTSVVLFRFDVSKKIGLGHAMRCYALIEALVMRKVSCVVVSKSLPEFMVERLSELGCDIELLMKNIDEVTQTIQFIKNRQANHLVIDGYQFSSTYRRQLYDGKSKQYKYKIICFDDTNDLSTLYCDVVINALTIAKQLGYQKSAPKAEHLLGLQYSIIRQEYRQYSSVAFSQRKILLVNFGGSDIGGLTLPVIELLHQTRLSYADAEIVVVTGGGCENTLNIEVLCKNAKFRHIHNCTNMAKLLHHTRLALCAPGAIIYELAYCQVPSVFFTVASNQKFSAKAHQDAGWAKVFDGGQAQEVSDGVNFASSLWINETKLQRMSAKASLLVDGKGVDRLVEKINFIEEITDE